MILVANIILCDCDGRYVMLTFVLAAENLNNTTCFILNSKTEVKFVVDFLLILYLIFYILFLDPSFLHFNSVLHQSYKTVVTHKF